MGVVVIGTGLPMVCTERQILKHYFDGEGKNGFDYAYRCPGMNKVQQAAGRLIRTPEDRGVILLLDSRFREGANRALYPREWEDLSFETAPSLERRLTAFWNGK